MERGGWNRKGREEGMESRAATGNSEAGGEGVENGERGRGGQGKGSEERER